jgi:hypothetical protein
LGDNFGIDCVDNKQVWWSWDQGDPTREGKITYGYVEIWKQNLSPTSPVSVRIVYIYPPSFHIWQELSNRLQNEFLSPLQNYNLQVPAQNEIKKISGSKSAYQAKLKILLPQIIYPPKPPKSADMFTWLQYYHDRLSIKRSNYLADGYSLKELAKDSGKRYDEVRHAHAGCPLDICARNAQNKHKNSTI